ncbi:hypothetical protein J6590_073085 [Homalodisca vitripennis]|nr:hypothetical protein J6590_073085 [Homalodisca vitripennis]
MSSHCGICGLSYGNDENEQKIKCAGSCENLFHYRCVQEDVDGAKTRSFRDWKCKSCRGETAISSEGRAEYIQELFKVIKELKSEVAELKSTRNELNSLSESMQFVSKKMDESTNLMKEIKVDLAALKKENEYLRNRNAALDTEVTSLKDRVRQLEHYSRKNNLEISGIPETPKENVFSLVKDIGAALGVQIQENDISTAHRVPSFKKDRPQPLIFCPELAKNHRRSRKRAPPKLGANHKKKSHATSGKRDNYLPKVVELASHGETGRAENS